MPLARIRLTLLTLSISFLADAMRGTDKALCFTAWLSNAALSAAHRAHRAVMADITAAYINALTRRNALRDHLSTPDKDAPSGSLGDEFVGIVLIACGGVVLTMLVLDATLTEAVTLIARGGQ